MTLCCVRHDGSSQRGKTKVVRIPVTSNAGFEEVLEDIDDASPDQPVNVEQLARLVDTKSRTRASSAAEIRVRVTAPSPDVSLRHDDDDVDLPRDCDISLTALVAEPCVLASVDSPDRPAFHLPLRTGMIA